MESLQDTVVKNYNTLVDEIINIFSYDMKEYSELSNTEKLNSTLNFYTSLENPDLFLLFSKKKIKLFSSKKTETYEVSKSLFGEDMLLKRLFNNQKEIIKSKLWNSLFNLYISIETTKQKRQDRLVVLSNGINNSTKELSSKVKSDILSVDVNDTTNNMIDDIVGSFQNLMGNNENPFDNIMSITNMITDKYQDGLQNGDIEIDKLMGSIQTSLPGMDKLMGDKNKPKEKIVIDENFSTSKVEVGKKDESQGFNIGNIMNVAKNIPNITGLSNMVDKLSNAESAKDIDSIKNDMDSYLEKELGVDVKEFNKNMEDMTQKLEEKMLKNKLVED